MALHGERDLHSCTAEFHNKKMHWIKAGALKLHVREISLAVRVFATTSWSEVSR